MDNEDRNNGDDAASPELPASSIQTQDGNKDHSRRNKSSESNTEHHKSIDNTHWMTDLLGLPAPWRSAAHSWYSTMPLLSLTTAIIAVMGLCRRRVKSRRIRSPACLLIIM